MEEDVKETVDVPEIPEEKQFLVKESDMKKLIADMYEREKTNIEVEAEQSSYAQAIQYYFSKNKGNMVFVDFKYSAGKQKLMLCTVKDEMVCIKGIYYGLPPTSIWYDTKNRARAVIMEGIPTAINRDLMFNPEVLKTYNQKMLLALALKGKNEVLMMVLVFILMGLLLAAVVVDWTLIGKVNKITNYLATITAPKTGAK